MGNLPEITKGTHVDIIHNVNQDDSWCSTLVSSLRTSLRSKYSLSLVPSSGIGSPSSGSWGDDACSSMDTSSFSFSWGDPDMVVEAFWTKRERSTIK